MEKGGNTAVRVAWIPQTGRPGLTAIMQDSLKVISLGDLKAGSKERGKLVMMRLHSKSECGTPHHLPSICLSMLTLKLDSCEACWLKVLAANCHKAQLTRESHGSFN